METRANHLWVGAVTLVLLAALAAFIVWIARLGEGRQDEFDIFYGQSVSGLANGSQVSFAGVPVGQVTEIALADGNPEFVRVRIKVKDDVPILVGTQATIQASFTGVSTILLDGARKDAPAITCETTACPEGRPVIPPGRGGFGEIVANAPLLLERLVSVWPVSLGRSRARRPVGQRVCSCSRCSRIPSCSSSSRSSGPCDPSSRRSGANGASISATTPLTTSRSASCSCPFLRLRQ